MKTYIGFCLLFLLEVYSEKVYSTLGYFKVVERVISGTEGKLGVVSSYGYDPVQLLKDRNKKAR